MKDLAYKQGMDKAAQEFGYPTWEEFEKDAAPLLMTAKQVGRQFAGRGAMIGAGVGALGGAMSGPEGQSMGDRLQRGLVGAGVGAAGGAALGGAGGYLGQKSYQRHVGQFANNLKSQGVSPKVVALKTQHAYKDAPHFLSRPMQPVNNAIGSARDAIGRGVSAAKNTLWG